MTSIPQTYPDSTAYRLQAGSPAPVGGLWPESYIATQEIEVPVADYVADPYKDISNFAIIIVLVIYLLLAHRRIIDGAGYVLSAIFKTRELFTIEDQSNVQTCRDSLFMFLTMCASFVFANISRYTGMVWSGITLPLKFIGIFGFILIWFMLRKIGLHFLAWQNNDRIFVAVHKITYTYTCLWYSLVLVGFLFIKSFGFIPLTFMREYLVWCLAITLLFFFSALYKIFIAKGFSLFFYILYLCTFEIFPIAFLLSANFK